MAEREKETAEEKDERPKSNKQESADLEKVTDYAEETEVSVNGMEGDDEVEDEEEEEEEEEEEDDIKVTIEDFDVSIHKQTYQPKQVAQPLQETVVDIGTLEDKPWRKPGADINDYFNYGFDESTWRTYCERQKQLKAVVNEQEVHDAYPIPVLPATMPPVVIQPHHFSPVLEHHQQQQQQQQQQLHVPPRRDHPTRHHSSDDRRGSGRSREHREERRVERPPSRERHSRSPHTRKQSRTRKRSKSRERRRSRSKERTESKKRRSRSRERDVDDRRSKRHKSSRRA